jgi:hypothetical protein
MRVNSSTRFAAIAAMVGALACAGNTAREADTDETAAARDTTTADTLGGQQQNPPGYRGMETDTSMTPNQQPTDTFLQNQGTGQAQDTSGYSGMERVDTTGQQGNQQGQTDTTSMQGQTDTTSMQGQSDTSSMGSQTDTTSAGAGAGAYKSDTSATGQEQPTGDTTGYDSHQQTDTTTSR